MSSSAKPSRAKSENKTFTKSNFQPWINFDPIFSRNHRGCIFFQNAAEKRNLKNLFSENSSRKTRLIKREHSSLKKIQILQFTPWVVFWMPPTWWITARLMTCCDRSIAFEYLTSVNPTSKYTITPRFPALFNLRIRFSRVKGKKWPRIGEICTT